MKSQTPSFESLLTSQKKMLDRISIILSSMEDTYSNSKFLSTYQYCISDILAFLDINITHERKNKTYFLTDDDIKDFSTLQTIILTNLERIVNMMNKLNEKNNYDVLFYLDTIIRYAYSVLSKFIRK